MKLSCYNRTEQKERKKGIHSALDRVATSEKSSSNSHESIEAESTEQYRDEKLSQKNSGNQQVEIIIGFIYAGVVAGGSRKGGGGCPSNHLGSAFHWFSMRSGTSLMQSTKG